ncbi:hypothetical protein HYFRA_00012781 [Hymenoscyphus fraxineus]|uniref:NmrA-like domain-containing protein n=1 Tax=Hymenoscyphus fraxineus TaxID=746836 RepID=A0A9N9PUH3_9HELO|nr:hypothetical protein HYFRA_00012781 [Hymenoscyphus fraxineus]
MATHPITKIFIIGGTGAQGLPIIHALAPYYQILVLTRDTTSPRAQSLLSLPTISLLQGSLADEAVLKKGFTACQGAFINIDGFNTGEQAEMYWAIRCYEIALRSGVRFFVYANLEYMGKITGYDERFRAGHYDGKGRVGEWILFQNRVNCGRMGSALFTTGPYIEMCVSARTLLSPTIEEGVVTWRAPMGDGCMPAVSLEDCGYYVRWLFENRVRADGMDLQVAIADVGLGEVAQAFMKVTGKEARYVDVEMEEFWSAEGREEWGERPAGYSAGKGGMSMRENFTGFWNIYKHKILKRDYKLLDEIHPNRIKSVEEWFRRENQKGIDAGKGDLWERVQPENLVPVLKLVEDDWKGSL